jgi:hypothetical protein
MRIDLPSGNYVDIRDNLMAADKFAVQDSIVLTISGDKQEIGAGIQNRMRNALLGQIITGWSFPGIPIPSQNALGGINVIGTTMDVDDYNFLSEKVQDLLDKVSFNPNLRASAS